MNIAERLVKFNESKLPENFVSIATKIENNTATHAAILIRHKKINYLHHFPGFTKPEVIENFNEEGWYIYSIWEVIKREDENDVGAFLQHCRRVCKESKITYSYILDGSHYDITGKFVPKSKLPELGTCVGFCVNTLNNTSIDIESYFKLEDWDDAKINKDYEKNHLKQTKEKYPDLDWSIYNAFRKRITPIEYLCSSFYEKCPITKKQCNSIEKEVSQVIQDKFTKK